MQRFTHSLLLSVLLLVYPAGCGRDTPPAAEGENYLAAIEQWRAERLQRLKAEDGWLSLAGLFWLEEGPNSFGSGPQNQIVFPAGKAPEKLGLLMRRGNSVTVKIEPGIAVTAGGKPVTEMQIFGEPLTEPVVLKYGDLSWFIIQRGDRIGVRLRDAQNPAIAALDHIDSYPVDPRWRIAARLERYESPRSIQIENILGMVSQEETPGRLVFNIEGKTYRLQTLEEGDELFVIFRDASSGVDTYPAGRYLYVKKPEENAETWIDFNKAYNPPCAYTDYATCPLPPPDNYLPIVVNAGEQYHQNR